MDKQAEKTKKRARPKSIEEVVQFALGHRIRVELLIVLNDGVPMTATQLADAIDEPLNNVNNHLKKMLEDGSVEIANEVQKGNIIQYWYRSVAIPFYSQKVAEEMTYLQRQMTAGAIVQSGSAEVLAGLFAGNLADPRTVLFWDHFNVDIEGREAMEAETERYLERIQQIEIEATNRRAKSGEESTSMLVSLSFFERVRQNLAGN